MICRRPRWEVKVTHIPTGIEVVRNSDVYRNRHLAKAAALKYLQSRLYMLGHNAAALKIEEVEVACSP